MEYLASLIHIYFWDTEQTQNLQLVGVSPYENSVEFRKPTHKNFTSGHYEYFNILCEIWSLYGDEYSSRGLLSCDTVQWCGRIPTFRRSMLPSSSRWSDCGLEVDIDTGLGV
jgi:hypothetical protein